MCKRLGAVLLLIGCLLLGLTGCGTDKNEPTSAKTVAVVPAQAETYDTGIDYIGIVQPKEVHNYAFLTGGKIAELYVAKGDQVQPGDKLAKLDTTQLELSAAITSNSASMAQNNIATLTEAVQVAEESLHVAEQNLARYQALYADGAISQSDLENMQLQYDSQQASFTQLQNDLATAEMSAANSGLSQQQMQQNLADSTLRADSPGIVMELPFKENEIAGAGYPVVITKSEELVVKVGVSTDDYGQINKDCPVAVNGSIEGHIDTIAAYPDEVSRVYTVEIICTAPELSAGDTVDVRIFTGQERGYFVPLSSVFQSDGIDYVFVVSKTGGENNAMRVNKRQVTLDEMNGSNVLVQGLSANDLVVTDGVKLLNENDIVVIEAKQ